MNFKTLTSYRISVRLVSVDPKPLCSIFRVSRKSLILSLPAFLIWFAPLSTHGQNASDVAQARLDCAQGHRQRAVTRAQGMGLQGGLADVCVKSLAPAEVSESSPATISNSTDDPK